MATFVCGMELDQALSTRKLLFLHSLLLVILTWDVVRRLLTYRIILEFLFERP